MKRLLLALLPLMLAQGQMLSTAWVELGEGGQAIARVVVNSVADCPSAEVDGKSLAMTPRSPVPAGFRPVCEAAIPAGTQMARVKGQALALPHGEPSRIA